VPVCICACSCVYVRKVAVGADVNSSFKVIVGYFLGKYYLVSIRSCYGVCQHSYAVGSMVCTLCCPVTIMLAFDWTKNVKHRGRQQAHEF